MSESQQINQDQSRIISQEEEKKTESIKVEEEVEEENEEEDEVDAFYGVELADTKDYAEYPDDSAYYEQHDDDDYDDYEYDAGLDWNESGYFD
jgi:hypothetical protein